MRRTTSVLVSTLALTMAPAMAAAAGASIRATGGFEAAVDFSTLSATSTAHGNHCQLTVQGTLTFTGTLVGEATGQTTAKVLAPCQDVLAAPPGTFRDVFRFAGEFTGTTAGTSTAGDLTYTGVTRPGGVIDATVRLHGTSKAVLRADATVAVGGTYTGIAMP